MADGSQHVANPGDFRASPELQEAFTSALNLLRRDIMDQVNEEYDEERSRARWQEQVAGITDPIIQRRVLEVGEAVKAAERFYRNFEQYVPAQESSKTLALALFGTAYDDIEDSVARDLVVGTILRRAQRGTPEEFRLNAAELSQGVVQFNSLFPGRNPSTRQVIEVIIRGAFEIRE